METQDPGVGSLLPFDFVLDVSCMYCRFTQGTRRATAVPGPGTPCRDLGQPSQAALLRDDSFQFRVIFAGCHYQPIASIGPALFPWRSWHRRAANGAKRLI